MMNLKKATVIFSTTLSSILCFNSIKMAKADTVHNTGTITMTVMHTSKVYNKKGKSTGKKFKEYDSSVFSIEPVTINGAKYYECYEGYIKKANIDGVKRKLTNNSYIIVLPISALLIVENGNFKKVKPLLLMEVPINSKMVKNITE